MEKHGEKQEKYLFQNLTEKIIGCAIEVHSNLGPGLLEKLYEEALEHEFELNHVPFERQKPIGLKYKGKEIGDHRVDFLVEDKVIVELKAVEAMTNVFQAQLLTYLKVTNKRVGLLINFNVPRLKDGIRRLVL